ncbi:DUF6069 family protein [Allonocardiopsis opalescens]|uniref:Uncharacterized protein n=1 Tax=Allonocardiopsis opalescens TaxID=1144618 RepID=A0A2T0PTR9_9ACTN|nr:DUF6069 family protein [Allonocardiopsis opalescens]PRX92116.1 hypothetical protein CLV72_1114 [Allonocardiopsis opalescens]
MAAYSGGSGPRERPGPDSARLWVGGVATAVVAALVALIGVLVFRSVLRVPVLGQAAPGAGIGGDLGVGKYALTAAFAALVATALANVLLVAAPRPLSFFGWIGGLMTALAAVAPFTYGVPLREQIALALINLFTGAVIVSLLSGAARSAGRGLAPLDGFPATQRHRRNPPRAEAPVPPTAELPPTRVWEDGPG